MLAHLQFWLQNVFTNNMSNTVDKLLNFSTLTETKKHSEFLKKISDNTSKNSAEPILNESLSTQREILAATKGTAVKIDEVVKKKSDQLLKLEAEGAQTISLKGDKG